MLKIAEHRATVLHVQEQVQSLKDNITEEGTATRARLDAISSDTNATQASVTNLRTLAEQIAGYIRTFPRTFETLYKVLCRVTGRCIRFCYRSNGLPLGHRHPCMHQTSASRML